MLSRGKSKLHAFTQKIYVMKEKNRYS